MADEKKHSDDTLGEEISAFGERAKGAAKDTAGSLTGNRDLEREGERENLEGRARQAHNDVFDETDGVPGRTVRDRSETPPSSRGGSVTEEASAFGERMTGAAKDVTGAVLGIDALEREGERENAAGRARQARNDAASSSADRTRTSYVTGLYRTPDEASQAYESLTSKHGYKADDVDVMMSDETRQRYFEGAKPGKELSSGTKAAEGFAAGGTIGGGVGAALGALFAVGSNLVIPGLGLVVAGPIAAALAGAGAGGATGGLIGALIGAGIPEDRARQYDEGVRQGGILIGTRARDDAHAAELERDYNTFGGTSILR